MKSTSLLERLDEELRQGTRVVRIFPNAANCLRLTRAPCAETHEAWLEDNCRINTDLLREQRKEQLRKAAQTSDPTANLHNFTYTTPEAARCNEFGTTLAARRVQETTRAFAEPPDEHVHGAVPVAESPSRLRPDAQRRNS